MLEDVDHACDSEDHRAERRGERIVDVNARDDRREDYQDPDAARGPRVSLPASPSRHVRLGRSHVATMNLARVRVRLQDDDNYRVCAWSPGVRTPRKV